MGPTSEAAGNTYEARIEGWRMEILYIICSLVRYHKQ
jgi:hypothetical protein